jgi:hypothetical protein
VGHQEEQDEAARNRELMPQNAAIIAGLRAAFGADGVKVRWLREGEREIGCKRYAPAEW